MPISFLSRHLLVGLIFAALAACNSSSLKSADETLRAMGVKQNEFGTLSVCDQIRIYTDVGSRFLDLDHGVALVPSWVDDTVGQQSGPELARCISQEGLYRLGLLAGHLDSKANVSLAVHTLVYKAEQLKLLKYPEVQALLNEAVCKHDLDDEFALALIYYVDRHGKAPQFVSESNSTTRMRTDLCGQ